jgi:hypothetical protein
MAARHRPMILADVGSRNAFINGSRIFDVFLVDLENSIMNEIFDKGKSNGKRENFMAACSLKGRKLLGDFLMDSARNTG